MGCIISASCRSVFRYRLSAQAADLGFGLAGSIGPGPDAPVVSESAQQVPTKMDAPLQDQGPLPARPCLTAQSVAAASPVSSHGSFVAIGLARLCSLLGAADAIAGGLLISGLFHPDQPGKLLIDGKSGVS